MTPIELPLDCKKRCLQYLFNDYDQIIEHLNDEEIEELYDGLEKKMDKELIKLEKKELKEIKSYNSI